MRILHLALRSLRYSRCSMMQYCLIFLSYGPAYSCTHRLWLLWSHGDAFAVKLHVQCLHKLEMCTKGALDVSSGNAQKHAAHTRAKLMTRRICIVFFFFLHLYSFTELDHSRGQPLGHPHNRCTMHLVSTCSTLGWSPSLPFHDVQTVCK